MRPSPAAVAWCAMLAIGAGAGPAHAQDVEVHGQVRPRTEIRDLGGSDEATLFTSMRVRADLLATREGGVSMFLQLQDVRLWGEETNTLGDFSADNLDLHQGFVRLPLHGNRVVATVGRQETNLGGQRLIGAVGWTPQGRSFDGVRLRGMHSWGSVDLLAYKLREGDIDGVTDAELLGVYTVVDLGENRAVDLYLLYNGEARPLDTDQATFGARFTGSAHGLAYRAEGSLQRGTRSGDDVAAYMGGARVGKVFREGRGSLSLWYDYLSGDSDANDERTRVFDTLFGTNHKFYGFADLFLNIPAHTGGLGLRDAAIKASYLVRGVRGSIDLHQFNATEMGALPSQNLGQELDVTLSYRHTANVGFTAGHSYVWATESFRQLGRSLGNVHFAYLMLDATF